MLVCVAIKIVLISCSVSAEIFVRIAHWPINYIWFSRMLEMCLQDISLFASYLVLFCLLRLNKNYFKMDNQ